MFLDDLSFSLVWITLFQVRECLRGGSCSSHLGIMKGDRIEEEDCIEKQCFVPALSNNIGKFYNPSDFR